MSNFVIGLMGMVIMILMILIGIPVFVSLAIVSIIGMWLVGGLDFMLIQFTTGPFNISASYQFAVIPLFVLMGMFAGESKIGEWAYEGFKRWIGKKRGGLLIATVAGNAVFGACSGMSTAGTAVFAKIAFPQLKQVGYQESFSLACLVASGSLSSLIPPSMPILLFSILTGVSIGQAFIAGIGPGILMVIIYSILIYAYAIFRPSYFPIVKVKYHVKDKIKGFILMIPILGLFTIVIGGIYAGIFTPTVGGAVGSVTALLFALISGTQFKRIYESLWDSVKAIGRIFPIIMSAIMYSRFIAVTELPQVIGDYILRFEIPKFYIYLLSMGFYLIIGCFMDVPSIIFITSPIVFPLLTQIGYDPLVVVIAYVFMAETGGLTPPFGLGVFFLSSLLNIPSIVIFRNIWIFVGANLLIIILIGLIPEIVTLLPRLLY
uniref:TRAP transporter large permease subunit n=1 Tax=candidate division WOR-3 bacterium TaxID=2052148 RepID=A0A7C2K269_UNCW3